MSSIDALYHIAHVDNLASYFTEGLLSRSRVQRRQIEFTDISDSDVQHRRNRKLNGRDLHTYASLYFNPANAMMGACRIRERGRAADLPLCVLSFDRSVLAIAGVIVTDRNAAAADVQSYRVADAEGRLDRAAIFYRGRIPYRRLAESDEDRLCRQSLQAEVLVPDSLPPDKIVGVTVPTRATGVNVRARVPDNVPITVNPLMFERR